MDFALLILLASEPSPSTDVLGSLLVYGPLGIFVVLFATGIIVAKPVLDRSTRERDEALVYARGLEQKIRDEIVPLLVAVNTNNAEATKLLARATALLEERRRTTRRARDDD